MTPVLARPRPAPPRSRGEILTVVLAAAGGIAILILLLPALRLPAFVDAVTISNPHQWNAEVDADGPDRSRWIGLGTVPREGSITIHGVIDQGTEWVFRFAYGGSDGGELVVSRVELERNGWKITIPDDFAQRMRAAGIGPSVRG